MLQTRPMHPLFHNLQRPNLLILSASTIAITSLAFMSLQPTPSPSQRSTMTTTSPASTFPTRNYTPRHTSFPYTKPDLTPSDPSSDISFYSSPRFVAHIDDHAISLLRNYYGSILPPLSNHSTTTRKPRVLDLCSSWVSHYPPALESAAKAGTDISYEIAGTGMNAAELAANPLFGGKGKNARWIVKDLNAEPELPALSDLFSAPTEDERVDATTLTVSIDYMTDPVGVLASLLLKTRPGGTVHLAISDRCFSSKAVSRWLRIDEEERLLMVGDYLWFAGWRDIEIVTLSDGRLKEEEKAAGGGEEELNMKKLMALVGLRSNECDPLWVVRGKKVDDGKVSQT